MVRTANNAAHDESRLIEGKMAKETVRGIRQNQ